MSTPQEQAGGLIDALRGHPTIRDSFDGEVQEWFWALWTRVAIALGDEPVEYLDGLLEGERGAYSLNLIIYTQTRLVRATGSGPDDNPETKVWTVGRRQLREVAFHGGGSVTWYKADPAWPGKVSCAAEYPEETLHLPQPYADGTQRRQFLGFLPSLLGDLARP